MYGRCMRILAARITARSAVVSAPTANGTATPSAAAPFQKAHGAVPRLRLQGGDGAPARASAPSSAERVRKARGAPVSSSRTDLAQRQIAGRQLFPLQPVFPVWNAWWLPAAAESAMHG